jgi:hypothetical protein
MAGVLKLMQKNSGLMLANTVTPDLAKEVSKDCLKSINRAQKIVAAQLIKTRKRDLGSKSSVPAKKKKPNS